MQVERPEVRPSCAPVDRRVPGGPHGEAMRSLATKYAGLPRYPGFPMLVVTAYLDPPALPHRGAFTKRFDTRELLAAVERLDAAVRTEASR